MKGGAPGPSAARLGGSGRGSCACGAGGVCAIATEMEQTDSSVTSFRIIPPNLRQGPRFYRANARSRLCLLILETPTTEPDDEAATIPNALKRMFTLAMQAGKLLYRPHIPMLEERNTRKGFFDLDMLHGVLAHLPEALQPVIEFAYITGWRIPSEVLTLEWRQVDFKAGEVRLDPETTKNRDGRVFFMTDELRALLEARYLEHQKLRLRGQIVPWVFFRMVAVKRRGPKEPRQIRAFAKAWASACARAGCPGRIPHDLRRTAVRNMIRRQVPERVAMALAVTKHALCSTATTSYRAETFARRRPNFRD